MGTSRYSIRNRLQVIKWRLATHQLALKLMVALLAALAIIAALWRSWDWIRVNSPSLTFIATLATGVALAIFAWLTYKLSSRMVEHQFFRRYSSIQCLS